MKSIRTSWPVAAVLGGVLVTVVLTNVPGGRTVLRFLPPVAVAAIGWLCFGELARRDRPAFLSIIGPAFAVAIVATVAVGAWGYLTLAAVGFLELFILAPDRTWPWWWRHILRRPMPSATQTFNRRLAVELTAWATALQGPEFGAEHAVAAERAIARIRGLQPPDDDWSVLRDDYVEVAERWTQRTGSPDRIDVGAEFRNELVELEARRRELADRT